MRIKELRETQGFQPKEIADVLRCSLKQYEKYEKMNEIHQCRYWFNWQFFMM